MTRVRVARIARVHGLRGEVALDGVSLTVEEMRQVKHFRWRSARGEERDLTLAAARPAHDRMLVQFEGVDDRDQAQKLSRGELFADADTLPAPSPGEVYSFQLLGCTVRTEDGRVLGTLEEIVKTGANPIYVVRGDRERLLPAPPEFVRAVDLEGRTITLALPPGFEEL